MDTADVVPRLRYFWVAGPHKCGDVQVKTIANFHIGSRTTAIAWSSRVSSPSSADGWSIEYTYFVLYVGCCGGRSEDSSRYVATVSDDKILMVWDLHPSIDLTSPPSPGTSPPARPQPTAYVIIFPHPLTSVNAHPSTSKELLTRTSRRNSSVVELVEPRALADSPAGSSAKWSGSVAWRRDPSADFVSAAYGSRFALWDMGNLAGGKPSVTGTSFAEGGSQFWWCPTYPDYFAVSTSSAARGAVIHVHNAAYVHAQPTVFQVAPRPLCVRAFDFVAGRGIPRIAAAVGREVIVFYIGVDS
ncbi:hypothetical protein C8Q79DRAFT_1109980 [Trametes meyenii]|nr:hypothetical protein C8Q79DRAFT_1109980 [Trametes meyenii]